MPTGVYPRTNPPWNLGRRTMRATRLCLNCGKGFETFTCYDKRGDTHGRFCSKSCASSGKYNSRARWVNYVTQEKTAELFEQYKKSKLAVKAFGLEVGIPGYVLIELFKKQLPYEYETHTESQMTNNNLYRRGRAFEYRVKDYLSKQGYFVWRSPRSAGPADLLAIKKGEILLIQCKMSGVMTKKEKDELAGLAVSIGAKAYLSCRNINHRIQMKRLDSVEGVV